MYKLLHKIFGWDYVYWSNSASQGISKVHVAHGGVVYYYRYKNTCLIDLLDSENRNIIWLTCPSSKYLKEQGKDD